MEQLSNLLSLGKELGYEGLELQQKGDMEKLLVEKELKEMEIRAADVSSRNDRTLSSRDNGSARSCVPKLPIFEDGRTDIDAYLLRFERFAESQDWPIQSWSINLSALLTGIALEVYSRLSDEEARDYQVLKMALLKRYQMNDEGFRLKFRSSKVAEGESSSQYIVRLRNYFRRWVELSKTAKSFDALEDLLIREQFLNSCNKNLAVFLKERSPKSTDEMAQLAEMYLEAHADVSSFMSTPKSNKPGKEQKPGAKNSDKKCFKCGKLSHIAKDCRVKNKTWSKSVASAISEDLKVLVRDQLGFKDEQVVKETSACVLHTCEHDCVNENSLKLVVGDMYRLLVEHVIKPRKRILVSRICQC